MKAAMLIENNIHQIILTPEGEMEKAILRAIVDGDFKYAAKRGHFAMCRGGYLREFDSPESTMIVIEPKPPEGV